MDQNRYVNTYIDVMVGQIHESVISNLQLKTQVKIANDMLQEKDAVIGKLQNSIDAVQNNDVDVENAQNSARHWEDSYHAAMNKVAHMETLMKQIKDMKVVILQNEQTIANLTNQIEELKTPKKVINTRTKKTVEPKIENKTDDF